MEPRTEGGLFGDDPNVHQSEVSCLYDVCPEITQDGVRAARMFSRYRKEDLATTAGRLERWLAAPDRVRSSKMVWHQWVGCVATAHRLWGTSDEQEAALTAMEMAQKRLWDPTPEEAVILIKGMFPGGWLEDECYDVWRGSYKYRPDSGYEMAALTARATGEEFEDEPEVAEREGIDQPSRQESATVESSPGAVASRDSADAPGEVSETVKPTPADAPRAPASPKVSDNPVRPYSLMVRRLTKEQLLERRTGITATDISAIAGLNPWKDALGVYLDKVDDTEPSMGPLNEAAEWGIMLEPFVLWRYLQEHHNAKVRTFETIRGVDNVWALATPDALVSRRVNRLVEIKTTGKNWDDVPRYYVAQVHWQWGVLREMGVDVHPVVHIPCFTGAHGFGFKIWEVEIDQKFLGELLELGRAFWFDHVVPRKVPPIEDSSPVVMKRMYPANADNAFMPSTPEAERLLEHLKVWAPRKSMAEKALEKIYTKLQGELGDAGGMEFMNGHRITWRKRKDSDKVSWKDVVDELWGSGLIEPDALEKIVRKHTTHTTGPRVWRPNVDKLLALEANNDG